MDNKLKYHLAKFMDKQDSVKKITGSSCLTSFFFYAYGLSFKHKESSFFGHRIIIISMNNEEIYDFGRSDWCYNDYTKMKLFAVLNYLNLECKNYIHWRDDIKIIRKKIAENL